MSIFKCAPCGSCTLRNVWDFLPYNLDLITLMRVTGLDCGSTFPLEGGNELPLGRSIPDWFIWAHETYLRDISFELREGEWPFLPIIFMRKQYLNLKHSLEEMAVITFKLANLVSVSARIKISMSSITHSFLSLHFSDRSFYFSPSFYGQGSWCWLFLCDFRTLGTRKPPWDLAKDGEFPARLDRNPSGFEELIEKWKSFLTNPAHYQKE